MSVLDAPLRSAGYRASPTITRPANVTPYAAGDVIGNGPTQANAAIELQNIGPAGGHIMVTGADLMAYIGAVPAGMGNFRLHVYDANPASALADNAPWDLTAGDRANYLGYIDIGVLADVGSTLYVQAPDPVSKQFKLAAGQTSLWGYLVTGGPFTPAANSETYALRVRSVGV